MLVLGDDRSPGEALAKWGHSRGWAVPVDTFYATRRPRQPDRRWVNGLVVRLHMLLPLNPEKAGRWVGSYVLITTSAARLTQGVPWLCVPLSREVCPYLLLRR